jgi:hypothetical protein
MLIAKNWLCHVLNYLMLYQSLIKSLGYWHMLHKAKKNSKEAQYLFNFFIKANRGVGLIILPLRLARITSGQTEM